ncbi:nitrous oxide reductase [Natronocella acetinitrilica]|uniref:Nitrous oxide reductase n=1 Tax=Natronocella acetinitrilica TaxID=414046 RepID=A0AAE3KAJ4_9GAMM|nr:transcriptional initiation protein Tat [Natronocella acetinitrilica]MCP1673609.1 nitrous oxide reductase [Natronocella acetinitrilica]
MKKQDKTGLEARRTFLKTMAATGGAVAVTAGLGTAAAAAPEDTSTEVTDEVRGYHETQHIRDYYARADF